MLVGSEGKRQSGAQGTLVGAVHHMRDRLDSHNAHVAAGTQRHLEKSRLVKGEPATGVLGVAPVARVVHRTQRARDWHKAPRSPHGGGPGVKHVSERRQALRRQPAQPLAREPLGGVIDGKHGMPGACAGKPGAVTLERLPIRRVQALETVPKAHLAKKKQRLTLSELLGKPRLPEETHHDDAGVVVARQLYHRHAGTGTLELDFVDMHHETGLVAHTSIRHIDELAQVEITHGSCHELVEDRAYADFCQQGTLGGPYATDKRHRPPHTRRLLETVGG